MPKGKTMFSALTYPICVCVLMLFKQSRRLNYPNQYIDPENNILNHEIRLL